MTSDYKDYILLGLRYINCATEEDLKAIARDVIEILPKEDFNVFLRLPKEVLRHGRNSLILDVLNGPVDDMVGLVVEAPRLQIGI